MTLLLKRVRYMMEWTDGATFALILLGFAWMRSEINQMRKEMREGFKHFTERIDRHLDGHA